MIIVSQNMADIATITTTNSPANLGAENLKDDLRGKWCRMIGSTGSISLKWDTPVPVGAVVIVGSTLKPSSKFRVRVYADLAGTILKLDSGWQWAAPGTIFDNEEWTEDLNTNGAPEDGNGFPYCVAPSSAVYLEDQAMVQYVLIELEDTASSFIDISRLVVGPYFRPRINVDYGQGNSIVDLSTHTRSASGSLRSEIGPIARTMSFSLNYIEEPDRGRVQRLMEQSTGLSLWISLAENNVDKELERDKAIYGRLSSPTNMQWQSLHRHSATYQIEGI